jgi:hypothetical protein
MYLFICGGQYNQCWLAHSLFLHKRAARHLYQRKRRRTPARPPLLRVTLNFLDVGMPAFCFVCGVKKERTRNSPWVCSQPPLTEVCSGLLGCFLGAKKVSQHSSRLRGLLAHMCWTEQETFTGPLAGFLDGALWWCSRLPSIPVRRDVLSLRPGQTETSA